MHIPLYKKIIFGMPYVLWNSYAMHYLASTKENVFSTSNLIFEHFILTCKTLNYIHTITIYLYIVITFTFFIQPIRNRQIFAY